MEEFSGFVYEAFFALLGFLGMAVVTLLWFILREISKLGRQMSVAANTISAHENRITRLENAEVKPLKYKQKR